MGTKLYLESMHFDSIRRESVKYPKYDEGL